MTRAAFALAWTALAVPSLGAQAPAAPAKVPVVAVVGCLGDRGTDWMLTSATEPTPSIANGPPAGEKFTGPTSGPNAYRLLGTSEFDLPAHKGHTVLVKGLLIKASPTSRVNVTSVTMVAPSCTATAK